MLIGNVGRDPDLKYTPSGIPVTSFRLATSDTWKDREGSLQEHTDWHTIVAWRGLAEVIHKLIKKGSRVYIEGKIQTRTFDDKGGSKKHVVEILAENMLLLESVKRKGDEYDDEKSPFAEGYLDSEFGLEALEAQIPDDEKDDAYPF